MKFNFKFQLIFLGSCNTHDVDDAGDDNAFTSCKKKNGWLGRAMVLGSFQCRGVLLLRHMVGQGPAVLAAGAGWVGYVFFFCFF